MAAHTTVDIEFEVNKKDGKDVIDFWVNGKDKSDVLIISTELMDLFNNTVAGHRDGEEEVQTEKDKLIVNMIQFALNHTEKDREDHSGEFEFVFHVDFVKQLEDMYDDWKVGYISHQYFDLPTRFGRWSGILSHSGLREAMITESKMLLWMGEKAYDRFMLTLMHREEKVGEQMVLHKILTITPFEEEETDGETDGEEEEEDTIETVTAMANAALESVNNLKRRLDNDNDNGESKRQHT